MKRRWFQVAFSETDGEWPRLHYWALALWQMLMPRGPKGGEEQEAPIPMSGRALVESQAISSLTL